VFSSLGLQTLKSGNMRIQPLYALIFNCRPFSRQSDNNERAINQFKIAYNECENRKRVLISAPIFFSARRFAA
ncbi:hypothetical protein, partial [Klebsiella pneumoniae]|uniref:hypothetical protein n=1 Tax=Klebsiella pneumoniae TaxID=573 RepID=UPI001D0DAF9E